MNEKAMTFPRKDSGAERRVGVEVSYASEERKWVSRTIRIFTGPRKALSA